MKPAALLFAATLAGLLMPILATAEAAAGFACARDAKPADTTACHHTELMQLDKAVDAAFARALASVDPLTALLLKRDQRWFADVVGDGSTINDQERKRLADALQRRRVVLERAGLRAGSPTGAWANAFNDAKVEAISGDAFRVEVTARAVYGDAESLIGCSAKAEVRRDDQGWFTGTAVNTTVGAETPPNNNPFKLRLRLQANTLRVVLTHDEQDSFCAAPEQITGTYFLAGGTAASDAGTAAAPMVKPSFDCATAKNLDEEEICADPELANNDVAVARAYSDVVKRADTALATHLRNDQRAWVKNNAVAFEVQLNPGWDKQTYMVHHTGNAREELGLRLGERLAMLTNLDLTRKGVAGLWFAHNALLVIAPIEGQGDGTVHAVGRTWDSSNYKSHCDFEADGRILGGMFKTKDSFPDLARDGATLVIGGREREQPDYCTRMRTSKARLFPIKAGAAIGASDGRIR